MGRPTIGDMVTRVREYMIDTVTPYRYSDETIIAGIFDGIRSLHRIRPDSRYVGLKFIPEVDYPYVTSMKNEEKADVLAQEFFLDERWELAIRYFAAGRCFEIDSADTINMQRAQFCYAQFNAIATT